jgi:hypothetical protein
MNATDEPIELSAFELLFKELGVEGALPGGSDHGGIDSTSQQIAVSEVAWISSVKTKI